MSLNTSRRNLPYMEGTDLANEIDTGFEDLATALDTQLVAFTQGTFASRPAAGTSGTLYFATDLLTLYYDNGSAWYDIQDLLPAGEIVNADIASGAAISYSKLNLSGSITSSDITNATIVDADISASAGISQSKFKNGAVVTALPASPSTSDECVIDVTAITGGDFMGSSRVYWHLKKSSSSAWYFIGGLPVGDRGIAGTTFSSATYGASSAGAGSDPAIVVPLSGTYKIELGCYLSSPASTISSGYMSYQNGATAASDNDAIRAFEGTAVVQSGGHHYRTFNEILTAGDTIQSQFRSTSGTWTVSYATLQITPISLS